MDIRKLSDALGAEVTGIDLNEPQDAATVESIRRAFAEHLVLVVRDQRELKPEAQVRFCEFFGSLGKRSRPADTRHEKSDEPAEVMFVSNQRENGRYVYTLPEGEMMFHIDQCYVETPARATSLYAITVPDEGGDTLFGNLCAAYDTLPDDLRALADSHRALNVFTYDSTQRNQVGDPSKRREHVQPMVVRHPVTGRKALYVNRLMTWSIEGLDAPANEKALARLFDHEERPEFVYRHKWRKDDLVLWDNQCTIHARTDFDPGKDRHLRRFTVAGGPLRT